MVEVTQADREAAADLASMSEEIRFGGNDAAAIRNGILIDRKIDEFVERVARHRIAAFNAGLEAAAKVAEQTKSYDDTLHKSGGFSTTGERISTAIRSLKIGEE